MTGALVVVPYDPEWPARFAAIAAELAELLDEVPHLGIEHVGSTSVPGLAAKPRLDIDVVVERGNLASACDALAAGGYEPLGEMGVTDRWAFRAPADGVDRNTYVVVAGSLALRDHLGLRDTLRARPDLRDEYAAVKTALAGRTDDIDEYVAGKTAVILEVLRVAGIPEDELAELERINT